MKTPLLLSSLLMLTLHAQAQFQVQQLAPTRNTNTAARSTPVRLTYSQDIQANTASKVAVFSKQAGGRKVGTTTVSGRTITFDPTVDFKAGETIFVTAPATVLNINDVPSKPLVYQFTTQVQPSPGTFVTGPQADVGATPTSIAPADVDGDGDLDLLVSNSSPNWVSVRLNDGTGSFTNGWVEYSVGGALREIQATDFDGDGDLDFAVISGGFTPLVTVGLNDGTGHFPGRASANPGYTNASGRTVRTADVDADADEDILIAASGDIFVSLNTGAGSFGPVSPQLALGGNGARDLRTADIDGDGDLDLLASVATTSSNEVRVLLNDGSGSFGNGYSVRVPTAPYGLATADMDGDGDLDILTSSDPSSTTTGTVTLLRNNGTGTFSAGAAVRVGSSPSVPAVADLDGDGDLDLVTASNVSTGGVSIRRNDGGGNFDAGTDLAVGSYNSSVTPADIDSDGDLDLLIINNLIDKVNVLYNSSVLATASAKTAEPVRVYPNPAQDAFTVEYNATAAQPATLTLTDPLGRAVYQQSVRLVAGRNSFPLSGASLAQGLYHLTLVPGTAAAVSQKVMINH
ncbi:FG-GAP-like repeat-containing protein [Hymenobacter cavernae]|uniref:T9SS C-terminal target domain-containing protein n=1 Tax=Hymenobacter cavernae TaxID=2044852 RepID=A0ABQ1UT92_9BACT|nr:FG-GAP-like repeat-containing protein [Hymenobacter cavernae]GGF26222.1 hypothetical protein GCM10011383_42180 [Hymenobacter cavernae]